MISMKAPAQQAITLTDPNHVREVYANNLAGIMVTGNIAHLTFSVVRDKHINQGMNNENVITSRLVIPVGLLNDLVGAAGQVAQAQALAPKAH